MICSLINCKKIPGRRHACMLSCFSCVRLCATLQTTVCQAPLAMEFSRQECWSGQPFPSSGDLHDPGIESTSLNVCCIGRCVLCHQHHLGSSPGSRGYRLQSESEQEHQGQRLIPQLNQSEAEFRFSLLFCSIQGTNKVNDALPLQRRAICFTLMAESEEELKSLLMKVKEESEKVGLKLNIH